MSMRGVAPFLAALMWPSLVAAGQMSSNRTAQFDDACANAAAAYVAHAETERAAPLRDWIAKCEAHPRVEVCQDTAEIIRDSRQLAPIKCKR
jgi:hypothetical protein